MKLEEFRRYARPIIAPKKRPAVDVLDDFVKSRQLVRCDCGHLFEEHSGPGARPSLQGTKPELPEGFCFHCACVRPKEQSDADDRANHWKQCTSCGNDVPLPERPEDHCNDCDRLEDCARCGEKFVKTPALGDAFCKVCSEVELSDLAEDTRMIREKVICAICGSKLDGAHFCPGCGGASL